MIPIMKKYNLIIFSILIICLFSCRKQIDTYVPVNPGNTATYPLNGEYWVRLDSVKAISGGDTTWVLDPYGLSYQKITLYNTATNVSDSIWVDDLNDLLGIKVKATCNPKQLIFSISK